VAQERLKVEACGLIPRSRYENTTLNHDCMSNVFCVAGPSV